MPLERIITGGQTGADQAGWRASRAAGIATGGFMPKGFQTEDGPRPEFAGLYGAVELPTTSYPERTRRNAYEAKATLWFGSLESSGSLTTHRACQEYGRPIFDVIEGTTRPSDVARWIRANGWTSLNVAGNRESTAPGIGERVERFLLTVFERLKRPEGTPEPG